MRFFEMIWMLIKSPVREWPLIWNLYWMVADDRAEQLLYKYSPKGPKLYQWLFLQTTLPWLIFALVAHFYHLVPALIIFVGILGFFIHEESKQSLFFRHGDVKAMIFWMYPLIHSIVGLTVLIVSLVPYAKPGAWPFFVGKSILLVTFWVMLPFTLKHMKNKLPEGWSTRVWQKKSEDDIPPSKFHTGGVRRSTV